MSRLIATLRLDVRLQHRYGFYYAAAFLTLVWVVLLRPFSRDVLDIAVPFVIFVDLGVVGFYFMAGTVLFEKEERTLSALVVSPLRFWEYLASKLATLTLLALVISLIVALASYGPRFNLLALATGIVLMSLLTLLVGFISVAPFDSISRYILPSQFYFLALYVPLIHFSGWWESPLFYLVPTQGTLLLLRGAFQPIAAWQVLYAILYQAAWVGGLLLLAHRAFERHMRAR